jgi:protein-tyrosine phosphatase
LRPSFTDLHSHLVPGVDDGSDSVEESLDSLRTLYAEGVGELVTTPHLILPRLGDDGAIDQELELHRRSWNALAEAAARSPDLPRLGLGQEIWASDAAAIRRVVDREDVGLGRSRFLLVEFGFELQGTHTDVVRAVAEAGRGIIIAHPERYRYLPGTTPLELMREWRDLGARLQVNAGSLTGHYGGLGGSPYRLAWEMVREGLLDLVATDHHGIRRSGVSPQEAFDALSARGERALAERALSSVPTAVLRDVRQDRPSGAVSSPEGDG